MTRILFASVLAAALAAPAVADQRIEDVAPKSSFLVIGIDDLGDTMESLKGGQLWSMWQSPEIQDMVGDGMEQVAFQLTMLEDRLGVEPDSLRLPTGGVGAAMFVAMNDDLGMKTLGMIGLVDFEDDEKLLASILDAVLEQADQEGREYETHDVGDVTVYEFRMHDDDEDEPDDPFGGMGGMGDPMAMIKPMLAGLDKMFICRRGGLLLVCTNLQVLGDALNGLDGGAFDSIGESEQYRSSLDQVSGGDAHTVVLLDKAAEAANLQPMVAMFGPMVIPALREMGLSQLKAASVSINLSPEGAIVEQRVGVLVEGEKKGFVGLLDTQTGRGNLPSFVGEDTVGYVRLNFEFDGVMDVINNVIDTLPFEVQQGVEEYMLQYGPDLNALFSSLGREIHFINAGEMPFVAVRTSNTGRLEGVVAKYAPQMGLEARDFRGNTIYSTGGFQEFAIGIGGGFVFIGEPQPVELALRTAGAGDAPTLAGQSAFKYAMRNLGRDDVVAWGFSDAVSMFDQITGPMGAFGGEFGQPLPLPEGVDLEKIGAFLKKHVGPSIWQVRSVDRGFVMVSRTLKAESAE